MQGGQLPSLRAGHRDVQFYYLRGEVIASETRQETEIYSTGGQSTGYGNLPLRVHSLTTTVQRIWVRGTDGRDFSEVLYDRELSVLKGHQIALVYGAGAGRGLLIQAVNLSTDRYNDAGSLLEIARELRVPGVSNAGFVLARNVILTLAFLCLTVVFYGETKEFWPSISGAVLPTVLLAQWHENRGQAALKRFAGHLQECRSLVLRS